MSSTRESRHEDLEHVRLRADVIRLQNRVQELEEQCQSVQEKKNILQRNLNWCLRTIGPKLLYLLQGKDAHFNAGQAAYVSVYINFKPKNENEFKTIQRGHIIHKIHDNSINDPISPIVQSTPQERQELVGLVGQVFRFIEFKQPHKPYDPVTNPPPGSSLGSLQNCYLHNPSLLLIMVHAMTTGHVNVPTFQEYIKKTWQHCRGLMFAGIASNMIEMGFGSCGNTVSPPFQIFEHDLMEAQCGLGSRYRATQIRLGLSLSEPRIKDYASRLEAANQFQYLPKSLLPTGTITHHIVDNVIDKQSTPNEKGQYIENLTAHFTRIITPEQQAHLGMYEHFQANPYRLHLYSDLTNNVTCTEDLSKTSESCYETLDEATDSRVVAAMELYLHLNLLFGNALWIDEVKDCACNKIAMTTLSKKLTKMGASVYSLPMANVKGKIGPNGADLCPGWKERMPENQEQLLAYLCKNNYFKTDVGKYSVDNIKDNAKLVQQIQQQLGIGPLGHIATVRRSKRC